MYNLNKNENIIEENTKVQREGERKHSMSANILSIRVMALRSCPWLTDKKQRFMV